MISALQQVLEQLFIVFSVVSRQQRAQPVETLVPTGCARFAFFLHRASTAKMTRKKQDLWRVQLKRQRDDCAAKPHGDGADSWGHANDCAGAAAIVRTLYFAHQTNSNRHCLPSAS